MEKILKRATGLLSAVAFIGYGFTIIAGLLNPDLHLNKVDLFIAMFVFPAAFFTIFFSLRWVFTGRAPWQSTPPKKL
jgi:hypothetical protein